jgi:signal transduction histidine kinase
MAATLAHEINNPLEAVTNLIYLAKGEPGTPETVQRYLTEADEELSRAAAIAKQTLGLHRASVAPEPVRVSDIFKHLLSLLSPKIKNKRIRADLEVASEVEVVAMRTELQQIFANLLANSIDAVALDGTIRIRIVARHDFRNRHTLGVRITIADNGIGISPAVQAKMFEPFVTTKEQSGTGLGLWVSRQIVQRHHGSIRFRSSVAPSNTWTVACIFLPSDGMNSEGDEHGAS